MATSQTSPLKNSFETATQVTMEASKVTEQSTPSIPKFLEEVEQSPEREKLIASLPTNEFMIGNKCYQYEGFWYVKKQLVGTLSCQEQFQAHESDIFLISAPKTGTTWLKALAFATLRRRQFTEENQHPLLFANPHDLVPFVEYEFHENSPHILDMVEHPRLLSSHIPSVSLPVSVHEKRCKIVYVCRNPKDSFVSLWNFMNKIRAAGKQEISLDEAVKKFTDGITAQGPFFDHVLGYWKLSQEDPTRVLFLKYEDMKKDGREEVKKLAEFLGCPFSPEEVADGLVDKIVNLCSFDSLSNLDVNKNGKLKIGVPNMSFFRQGEIGDSAVQLSLENAKLIDQVTEEKFCGSGLIL